MKPLIPERVPLVDYLRLEPEPHLVANACTSCGARFFDRRNACAACGSDAGFKAVDITPNGLLKSYTIVLFAAPGVPVPFIAGVVDCDGTSVRGNIVNVPAEPEHVHLGMAVRLVTFPVPANAPDTEVIGFGFEPGSGGTA